MSIRQGNPIVVGDDHLRWRVEKRAAATGERMWREYVAPQIQQTNGGIANAVRVDADGNSTITGVWTPATGSTLRVERRDPTGKVLWAYVDPPGDPNEAGRAVALDAAGNAYIAGETESDWLVIAFDRDGPAAVAHALRRRRQGHQRRHRVRRSPSCRHAT